MRTVIFDLDGTLADTSADLIAACNTAMISMGYDPKLTHVRDASTALRGGRAMLKLSFERLSHDTPEREIDRGYPILLKAYGQAINVHTTLYPGAIAAVEALRARGFAVGICTNKPEGLAEALMQSLGVRHHFASLIGADTLATRKPDAAPFVAAVERAGGNVTRSLLVGDTVTDRQTAHAANVPSVLVTFGPLGMGVADLSPEALLHCYEDLPDIAHRLIG